MSKKSIKEIIKQAREEREDIKLDEKKIFPDMEKGIIEELKEGKKKSMALKKRIKEKVKLGELMDKYMEEGMTKIQAVKKAKKELDWESSDSSSSSSSEDEKPKKKMTKKKGQGIVDYINQF